MNSGQILSEGNSAVVRGSNPQIRSLPFYGAVLLLALISMQCIKLPSEPVLPTWDVSANVPVLDTTRTVRELIEKSPTIWTWDPQNYLISYNYADRVLADSIGDRITASPHSARMKVTIGSVRIDSSQVTSTSPPVFPAGSYPFLSASTVRMPGLHSTLAEFSNLSLESGTARLTIRNDLPVPIEFPEPISLTDGLGRVVAAFNIGGQIAPGSTQSAVDDLAGRSTNNSITISSTTARDSITINTPGAADSVTFSDTSRISFGIKFTNMRVTSATARIPQQTLVRRDSSVFVADDSTFLQSLTFKSGLFSVNLTNRVDVDVRIRLRLPQLLHGGSAYDSTITIARNSETQVDFDIRHFQVYSPTPTRLLIYSAEINQLGTSGNEYRTISSADSVVVAVNITPGTKFIVMSGSGIIKPTRMNLDQRISLNLGELPNMLRVDTSGIRIPDARFTLNLTTPGFPARIYRFRIRATASRAGIIDSVQYRTNTPINLIPNGSNSLLFDDGNSTIVDVLNRFVAHASVLPDSFRILADSIIVNPDYDTTTARYIADTSKIRGDFVVDFPLNIGLRSGTVTDTFSIADKININQEDIDQLQTARLFINVRNSIPAAMQLRFAVMDTHKQITRIIPSTDSISINAAGVGANGFSTGPASSSLTIGMTRDDVRALANGKFMEARLQLQTTPGANSVKFRTIDGIRVGVGATIKYRVKQR